jgi:carbamoyltransferase
MKQTYIGLAVPTPHDPAIAVVGDAGEILFAQALERPLQNKRAWNQPPDDLVYVPTLINRYCEPDTRVVLAQSWSLNYQTTLRRRRPLQWASNKAAAALFKLTGANPDRDVGLRFFQNFLRMTAVGMLAGLDQTGTNLSYRVREQDLLDRRDTRQIVHRAFDHHLTHAAAAAYTSGFADAAVAVIDGYGEDSSTAMFELRNGKLSRIAEAGASRRASLGLYYLLLCIACGFDPMKGEEWKVMGLAPYGSFDRSIYDLLRPLFKVEGLHLSQGVDGMDALRRNGRLLRMRPPPGSPPDARADLAYTGQLVFCEVMEELLGNLARHTGHKRLALGGGCGLNSACNGKLIEKTPFDSMHVFAAPADDGNAIGAALLAYVEDNGPPPNRAAHSPYLGDSVSAAALDNLLRLGGTGAKRLSEGEAPRLAAQALAAGKIVGWMQGRAEFGPRALGNRSILADPRNPNVKDKLNERVKFREEFRPFAPSILDEYGHEYFEDYQPSPYMERALRFRDSAKDKVPGVVHVDGTGRLQTVRREWNPRYHALLAAFHELTGVPIVLNTSFNVMGKPIVHAVEDAVAVFYTSGLDVMFIEDVMVEKAS